MSIANWVEFSVFFALLLILSPLLGAYMSAIFQGKAHLHGILGWLERGVYRLCGVQPNEEMDWKEYAKAMLYFNGLGIIALFFLQLFQGMLFLNPQNFPAVEWTSAFNTAVSFVTNTNWQGYSGENTMSYLSQMAGLTVQNFVSAATGNAVLLALIRGLLRHSTTYLLGNFWVDLTRAVVYLLLPLSFIFALVLVSQGVIQNFSPYVEVTTLAGETQQIPMGPVASQIAIKQLGTNGGGFFNANSAHPFENPTPLSNFFETFALLCIPAASVCMYGLMTGLKRQGRVIFVAMLLLWLAGTAISVYSQQINNPNFSENPVLEGQETRFGTSNTVLWAISTTATANGSVNSMHSSLSPLVGGIAMFNLMIGELIFGGVGVGLCSILMYVLLTVFIAGLMVGRTPEYLGKKIEKQEMQWAMLAILGPGALILMGSGIAFLVPSALESLGNTGPHGLSEILYAFSSTAGNNGSAFAGLNANTPFYNIILGLIMLLGRLTILLPSLAIAGSLVKKRILAPSLGTFSTDTPLFGALLLSVIFIVAALTFFPALSLGPIIEQLLMLKGRTF